jgi:ATP-dependent helicase/nuclease subunit A
MRGSDNIPATVRQRQSEASDPKVSAWVAANAGSGKTYVLAQRVINLLLDGVEPEKILCITFTKAAAANMAKQVFDRLGAWVALDDAKLDKAIRQAPDAPADPARRTLARRLFARALETPGGLKVQTIHAFCTQLLHQFPFEANVAARFTVLDETTQAHLLEQMTLAVLLDGAADAASSLGRALASAMMAAADQTFRDVVRGAIVRRDAIRQWVGDSGDVAAAIAQLSKALGVDPADDLAAIEAEFISGSPFPPAQWPAIADALAMGSRHDQAQAERFAALKTLSGSERLETYLDIFCTGDRNARVNIVTRSIADSDPAFAERLRAEQQRACKFVARRRAVACRDRSAALLTVAYEVLKRYQDEKERRGLVDYEDLIDKSLALLRSVDAAWVHYKLDLGIDHLLIDEAQDTSRKQWEIVQRLVAEFTAGTGARGVKRTIFAVGDEKQSIYSFQNAAPKEFDQVGRLFARAHADSNLEFIFGRLEHSFRAGASVLAAVDLVFKELSGVVTSDSFPPHIALPNAPPGLIEIWEPVEPDERREMEGWDAPFDTVSETSPKVKLAQRIARTVRRLIDNGEPVGIARRPARYGDVLILVRQRSELFESIIRALKHERVDVAGADRLVLTDHIAVMDLMVLADALLLPNDDLALATALRSPLFGFEDDDLFAIAWDRGPLPLRAALARKTGEKFAAATALLDKLALDARRETPFAFYATLLGAGGARRRFLARLGMEANDALNEFLNLALEYERRETPSLQGFVAWLREASAEVKRDMEIARDEVRVMTVHGAKGLEAPIVILADTMTPPAGPPRQQLLALGGGPVIWAGPRADDVPAAAAARQKAQDEAVNEYRRLLYVGMTRAADRLIVCGAEGRNKRPQGCWYDLVREPLAPFLVEEDGEDGKVLRYRQQPSAPAAARAPAKPDDKPSKPPHMPSWLRQAVPAASPRAAPLSPSSAFDDDIGRMAQRDASPEIRQKALDRGRLVHRLMQALPDIPPQRRKDAAEHYLANAAKNFSAAERSEIATRVLGILDDQNFAQLFAAGSRAEVPIVGRIRRDGAEPIRVAGQVDRLTVTDEAVMIADYKTDRIVPLALDEVAPYVAQLALYRAVLSLIYPSQTVRAALVFTEGPRLIEVPVAAMDAALEEVLANSRHAAVKVP